AQFQASDPRLERAIPILLRGLQMCAHETYFDCPYYEQMMYVGDTRLEALVTYAITADDRLPRKALAMFDASRLGSGLTQSRYPSHVRQVIPPFSLWYVGMLSDHALWRGNREWVAKLMPGARGVLDAFLSYRNEQGLIAGPPGWNFMDWSHEWSSGIPPQGDFGASAVINQLMLLALGWAAELEVWLGEPELAQRWERLAARLAGQIAATFWDPDCRRFSDDSTHSQASEHAQALAILSGRFSVEMVNGAARSLLEDADLTRATIYMRHYLLETFRLLGRPDAVLDRLKLWFDLEAAGLKTTPETPEPTRSDCHGWGSTPLYHTLATLLGIRPGGFGFESVDIRPMLGTLTTLRGCMPHPKGMIEANLRRENGQIHGTVTLPDGLSGVFRDGAREVRLHDGKQEV
ncbi:MAG: alpha-L-rhamnosidase, partial [Chloroflexi bacterium]